MKKYDIQEIISKYIHSDPDITQDMILEYRNYASDFIDPISKTVNDFRFAICPRGYTTQCWFVQWATYRLLFQNPNITNLLIIAYSDEISEAKIFDDAEFSSSLFDIKVEKSDIYSDLWFTISDDIKLFEKCINQLAYIYSYQKIDSVSLLLLPYWYKNTKKILDHKNIKFNYQMWVLFVANMLSYDANLWVVAKEDFLKQNQNLLDNFFAKKLKKTKEAVDNFKDFEIFYNLSDIFVKRNAILAMYYDTFRVWNKQANSFVWLVS